MWMTPHCTNHRNIGYHWLMNCHGYRSHLTDMSVAYTHGYMIYNTPPHRWNYHSQMTYNPNCCMLNSCCRSYNIPICNCLSSMNMLKMGHCTNHHNTVSQMLMCCHDCNCMLTMDMSVAYRLWCMIYSMPPHRWNYHSQMTYNPDCCMLNNCYRHRYHLSNTQTCTMYISWTTQSMYNPPHNHQAQCTAKVVKRKKSERLF